MRDPGLFISVGVLYVSRPSPDLKRVSINALPKFLGFIRVLGLLACAVAVTLPLHVAKPTTKFLTFITFDFHVGQARTGIRWQTKTRRYKSGIVNNVCEIK